MTLAAPDTVRRPAFLYWGRRGPILRMARNLADAAGMLGLDCAVSLSAQNPGIAEFSDLGDRLLTISTFDRGWGAVTRLGALPRAWEDLRHGLAHHGSDAVVVLMPHVWTPFIMPRIRRLGLPTGVIIHDAAMHPGDPTALMTRWLLRTARQADRVFTLSRSVAEGLSRLGISGSQVVPLFHPDLTYSRGGGTLRANAQPLRILFFGRIMPYKGLSLFVDALEMLKAKGCAVEASIVGEGALGGQAARLDALGATVVNRWVGEEEVAEIFHRHDVVVLSHVEASQSGVAAAAFAQGLPVVTTPVGGLVEQVKHERDGLVASSVSATALAECFCRLLDEPLLLGHLRAGIADGAASRSAGAFLEAIVKGFQRSQ